MNMHLTTPVSVSSWTHDKLNHNDVVLAIGSCFVVDVISPFIQNGLFLGTLNPSGILYNAYTIKTILQFIEKKQSFTESDFFFYEGLWHSWNHHGSFSHQDKINAVSQANQSLNLFAHSMRNMKTIVITYSTSLIFEFKKSQQIVANCHKIPASQFNRRMATVNETIQWIEDSIHSIRQINSQCSIILTLSPVRHQPGDLCLNSVSKSILRTALYEVMGHSHTALYYFPSYEIVLDEFRDYRFFAEDLLHVSPLGIALIRERFLQWCATPEAIAKYQLLQREQSQKRHRPLH